MPFVIIRNLQLTPFNREFSLDQNYNSVFYEKYSSKNLSNSHHESLKNNICILDNTNENLRPRNRDASKKSSSPFHVDTKVCTCIDALACIRKQVPRSVCVYAIHKCITI